jgi:pimeloyl-ACP methyl ester carboxylesterase
MWQPQTQALAAQFEVLVPDLPGHGVLPGPFTMDRAVDQVTQAIAGDRDRINLPGARELAAGIPEAELRIVPGAGHLWNLEQPEVFTKTLVDFVGRHA